MLLGDLGLLTLSTRGDCPVCQTPKADTVCPESKSRQSGDLSPRITVSSSDERVPLYKGVWATPARVAGRKSRPRLLPSSEQTWPRPPAPNLGASSPEEPGLRLLPSRPLWWRLLQALVVAILNLLPTRATPRMFWLSFCLFVVDALICLESILELTVK